jgi:LPXTG-motif cell wall-anchored protein|tara:strand:- start:1068 stop:1181 length:114 start_codon:yes stop_codon:yes gene_type:complete
MGVLLYRNVDDITDVSAPLLGIAGLTLLGMVGLRRRK